MTAIVGHELPVVTYYADEARTATVERDTAIVAAHKAGHSLRAIAAAAGLSHTAIANIVNKDTST